MDKVAARKLVKDTFERPFDKPRFTYFAKNLFQSLDQSHPFTYVGNTVPKAYQDYISSLERVGQYVDSDEKKIDTLIVRLKKETSLERARTMQRNFIAWYLNGSRDFKDAALVAFLSPDEDDWRFSLVKMEYNLDEKGKPIPELTPARRWSFLVGAQENSHTAQSQLEKVLEKEERPSLASLEEAFNVEVVTREFFNQYRELFHDLDDALQRLIAGNEAVRNEFTAKRVDRVSFAKKLLGQIVFLYFLQKKGWLGVPEDRKWGDGDKRFLRNLFGKAASKSENFFNCYLEFLCYDALARQRITVAPEFYPRFGCKIPFLNGGLFDPINDYDWEKVDLNLRNDLFSNRLNEDDEGTGILDIFDLYNFTVREDEPLEKEVAIDPEMLGKVFENLLDVKDRKSKGTYYTPREIVHYMCQESLINYLDTSLNIAEAMLAKTPAQQGKLIGAPAPVQAAMKTAEQRIRVPREDIEFLVRKAELALQNDEHTQEHGETGTYTFKLPQSIRDNATLIDEKLGAIRVCDPAIGSGAFPVGMMTEIVRARNALNTFLPEDGRSTYTFKREAIRSCLYGVDIDPGAVEIAKLRLWLSLVVDEENINQIQPLPNLEYKIVCGNSLLGVERNMFNNELFKKLEELKPVYQDATDHHKKHNYREQIDALIKQIAGNNPNFDFQVYFSEVFHEKDGFDVIIANPPYGIVFDPNLKTVFEARFPSFVRNTDIYVAFYENGIKLLATNGTLVFVSPNTFLNGDYFKHLRKLFTGKTRINEVIDHKNSPVFDDPTVFVCTLSCSKASILTFPYDFSLKEHQRDDEGYCIKTVTVDGSSDKPFKPEDRIMRKVLKRPDVVTLDSMFFVKDVGFNYWTVGRGKTRGNSIGSRVFYQGTKHHEKDILFLKGRNIDRYYLGTPNNFLRHDYQTCLDKAVDTFGFSREFLELAPKIIYRQTAHKIIATIDNIGFYLDKTVHLIAPKAKADGIDLRFMLSLLNSWLFEYLYAYISQEREGRVFAQVKTTYIKQLPIVVIPRSKQALQIGLVEQIFALTKDEDYPENEIKKAKVRELEHQIDQLVYQLYGLTPEEIGVVEGENV